MQQPTTIRVRHTKTTCNGREGAIETLDAAYANRLIEMGFAVPFDPSPAAKATPAPRAQPPRAGQKP